MFIRRTRNWVTFIKQLINMFHRYLELRINMFIEIQYKFCTSVKLTSDEVVMHFKCCSSQKIANCCQLVHK